MSIYLFTINGTNLMFIKRRVKAWEQIKNFHTLSNTQKYEIRKKYNDFLLCFILLNIYAAVKINIEKKKNKNK